MKFKKLIHPYIHAMGSRVFLFLCCTLLLAGCASDMNSTFKAPKNAFGQASRLCIIADNELWEGPVGDSIRYYFAAAYPILPQPEPLFDLQHFTPQDLADDSYRKELRAYLVVGNLKDQSSPTVALIKEDLKEKVQEAKNVKVGYDKWAQGQTLVYMFAPSDDKLINTVQTKFSGIVKKYYESNIEQYEATLFFPGRNETVEKKLLAKFGVDMRLPRDYKLISEDDETVWLRKETDVLNSNMLIHKIPYTSQDQLSKEGIKAIRDELGKKYVSTEIEGTYMRTNDVDLPMVTKAMDLNGSYTIEARGIWDIVNDFMGGPFLGYLIFNKEKNELLYIDNFVHAPAKKKRDYMQHLEYINSFTKF